MMGNYAASFDRLSELLEQVPTQALRIGQVAGDKPGLLAGEIPVCRLREGTEGAAYGALIVEAVNALPVILKSLQSSAQAAGAAPAVQADENSPLRQQVEATITNTLHMLPGFKVGATATWSKLIYAAVEPWLAGGRDVLTAPAPVVSHQPKPNVSGEQQIRLDAVTAFCTFMLAKDDSETRPNEYALEQLVNEWDKAHNGGEQGGSQ